MMMRTSLTIVVCVLLLWPSAGAAQNREHLQMNADLRILQETVNRLQLAVNRLDAQLADTNKRLDAATAASVKGFADQQLLINQMTSTITTIRERLDDNSVRVSQLSQEFTAVREGIRRLTDQINTLVGLLAPPVEGGAPPATSSGAPPAGPDAPQASSGRPALDPVILPQSASYIFQQAMGDYRSQRYDSAIEGFREVIAAYPDSPDAAEAQYWIGESYNNGKNDCRSALPEYQKFVDTYKDSKSRAEGLYMIGYCYFDLGQRDNAQRYFQQVVKEYPNEISGIQAAQRLQGMGVKPQ